MLERWNRVVPPFLGVAFAALGVWSLLDGDYGTAALQFLFSAIWLVGAFWGRWRAILSGRGTQGP